MPKRAYEPCNFRAATLAVIVAANKIINEYAAVGYDLTLRQLYYQFVSRGLLPNTQQEYKKLGNTISKARRAGLVDWLAIVDRTRMLRSQPHWDSPSDILQAVAQQYRVDRWADQTSYVEVWFEKDALLGVFERAATPHRVPYFSCRGYASDSELWAAAQRMLRHQDAGKDIRVLHFGDHDPSGVDMTRDIEERLRLFGATGVIVDRLALTMAQVRRYNPPPNPAKETDSRFEGYREQYGDESWELDALDPTVLGALVDHAVTSVLDTHAWAASGEREDEARTALQAIATEYDGVVAHLQREDLL